MSILTKISISTKISILTNMSKIYLHLPHLLPFDDFSDLSLLYQKEIYHLFGQQDILTSMNGHFKPHCIALHCSRQRHFLDTAIYATTVEMIGKLNHTDHMNLLSEWRWTWTWTLNMWKWMKMKLKWNMNMKYSWNQCGNDRQIESELSLECEARLGIVLKISSLPKWTWNTVNMNYNEHELQWKWNILATNVEMSED